MAFYDPAWTFRHPVMSDRGAGGVVEHTWTVQKHMDVFWDNITDQTDAFDVIVTEADGVTLVPAFDYSASFDFAAKTMVLHWNSAAAAGSGVHKVFWVYWGKVGASDMTGAVVVATPREVLSSLTDPRSGRFRVQQGPAGPGSTTLQGEISATDKDDFLTWVQVPTSEISTSMYGANKGVKLYEVDRFDYDVQLGGVTANKDVPADNRIVEDTNGVTWFGVFTTNLVDGVDYTAVVHAVVAAPGEPEQSLYSHHLIQCRNQSEA